jgi:hypothetical protein
VRTQIRSQLVGSVHTDSFCWIPWARRGPYSFSLSRFQATTRTLIAPSGSKRTTKRSAVVAIGVDRRGSGRGNSAPWHLTGAMT